VCVCVCVCVFHEMMVRATQRVMSPISRSAIKEFIRCLPEHKIFVSLAACTARFKECPACLR